LTLSRKVKKGEIVPVNIVKAYEGVVVKLHRFLTSTLDGMSGQLHTLPLGSSGKGLRYQLNRAPGGRMDALEKI
jgi:hypothetical protein